MFAVTLASIPVLVALIQAGIVIWLATT